MTESGPQSLAAFLVLTFWTVQIQNVFIIAESSVGQCRFRIIRSHPLGLLGSTVGTGVLSAALRGVWSGGCVQYLAVTPS